MTLVDYILTYKVDDKIVCNLFDYYENYIKPLDKRFSNHSFYNSKLVLCWFKDHQDINPSMGWIRDRNHTGVKVCHCFGCGWTGNVIRLHQIIQKQYYNKTISERESCEELAKMFGIPLDGFEVEEEDIIKRHFRKVGKIRNLQNRYSSYDFTSEIRMLRTEGVVDLDSVNSECIKLIATNKMLYD